jgi:hypothetical protein
MSPVAFFCALAFVVAGCSSETTTAPAPAHYTLIKQIPDTDIAIGTFFFFSDPDTTAAPQIPDDGWAAYKRNLPDENEALRPRWPVDLWQDPTDSDQTQIHLRSLVMRMKPGVEVSLLRSVALSGPVLQLTQSLDGTGSVIDALGTAFLDRVDGDTIEVGTFYTPEPDSAKWPYQHFTVETKLLWVPSVGTNEKIPPEFAPLRRLELRNAYDLGIPDFDPSEYRIEIGRDLGDTVVTAVTDTTGRSIPYVQVFGLDQRNNDNPSDFRPDGRVDPVYLDVAGGYLFFPDLQPFDPSPADEDGTVFRTRSWPARPGAMRPYELSESERTPDLYQLTDFVFRKNLGRYHKYVIQVYRRDDATP